MRAPRALTMLPTVATPALLSPPCAPCEPAALPAGEVEVVRLRNGSWVRLRPVTTPDEPVLREFLAGLCPEALRLRFFSGAANIDSAAHWAAATGPARYGLIAADETGEIVGHATYVQLDVPRGEPARAEVAVEVADSLHGCGLGTILIERLAQVAQERASSRSQPRCCRRTARC
jgi:GNAT superfamily N-acetyltransferase